jgi:lysozyme family protein|tara:strand:- start:29667 stop:30200 length:534 start_codon:yes stop_codon:yes gene_type:complete
MAKFDIAYKHVLKWEGGYVNDPDDPGGETYRGVARRYWSKWEGWTIVDMMKNKSNFPKNLHEHDELQKLIHEFYQKNFWDKVRGDEIKSQDVAEDIFDFAVNAGVRTSSKLAQLACGASPDGVIGKNTIKTVNECNEELFIAKFALNKIAKYVGICNKRRSSRKYFFGWIRRVMEGL